MRKPTQREQLIVHLLDEMAEKLVRDGCPPRPLAGGTLGLAPWYRSFLKPAGNLTKHAQM
jgi:hypothetical protein